jgi:hypothetical protein
MRHDGGVRTADLYALQLDLECKRILSSGRVGRVPCPNPDELALIAVVRFLDGSGEWVRLREDATAEVAAAVAHLRADDFLTGEATLALDGNRLQRRFVGRTGVFTERPDPAEFRAAERTATGWVVRVDGEIAARATSARINDRAAEIGCETLAPFRRRGLARQACAAWADEVLASDRVGFYSYDFSNAASAGLAASLAVAPRFDVGAFDLSDP